MIVKDKPNKVTATLKVKVTAEFYDDETTAETLRFCVEQDLEEAGYDVEVTPLKEQEPRVMTLEEVLATPKDIAIWQEIKDDPDYKFEISPVAEPSEITIDCNDDWFYLEPKEPIIGIRFASEGYMPKETYGATWRCWTSRPTDAQREAVKWDD